METRFAAAIAVEEVKRIVREEIAKGRDESLQLRIVSAINQAPKLVAEIAQYESAA